MATTTNQATCSCCGDAYSENELVHLGCHPEIAVCAGCLGWLADRRSRVMPVAATDDVPASTAFWQSAGFEIEAFSDEFVIATQFGVELHITSTARGDRPGGFYLHIQDVDAVHDAWKRVGLPVSDVVDQPWEMREFTFTDPGGNRVRVGQNIG